MRNPNQRLMYTLGLGWITFAALGLGLRQILASPKVTVVIDRSYCAPAQWQQLADQYADLYAQQEQREITIDEVIYVSDFGQVVATPLPTPEEVQALTPNGLPNAAEIQKATAANPDATVLTCGG
ncbi:hypothetical protein IQ273_32315 [Nodosilinea sp. LEGE 07298]|uniref:hypothetical protein n=1 Tax=Nodosilinea sp. LEGE 07298 TaxID=2777970 RepID=UPI001880642D|nr:hypothetical protein [Nodosilinea sp. LEGE 07298]MBE9114053.1 hypothetical protein [Nodosilinea sp. LEGE 07298]